MSGPVSLQRQHLSISLDNEYFTPDGLQKETGQPPKAFRHVAIKELIDNALDASETAGVAPHIAVEFADDGDGLFLAVTDNGTGIPPDVVGRILDFKSRTSDKAAYRAPTRGLQGNAIKTLLGMPVALGAERGRLRVEAAGVRHDIEIWLTPAGVRHDHRQAPITTTGTRIELRLPGTPDRFEWEPLRWLENFGLFNPHARLQIREIGDFADGKSGFERSEPCLLFGNDDFFGFVIAYRRFSWRKVAQVPSDRSHARPLVHRPGVRPAGAPDRRRRARYSGRRVRAAVQRHVAMLARRDQGMSGPDAG